MRAILACLTVIAGLCSQAFAGDGMASLVPAFVRAVVSPDVLPTGSNIPVKPFAACLRAQGVTTADMRKAIKSGAHGDRAKPCLDKFIGL